MRRRAMQPSTLIKSVEIINNAKFQLMFVRLPPPTTIRSISNPISNFNSIHFLLMWCFFVHIAREGNLLMMMMMVMMKLLFNPILAALHQNHKRTLELHFNTCSVGRELLKITVVSLTKIKE